MAAPGAKRPHLDTDTSFNRNKNSLDDDEWEYEYDEDETEDYYVTLDLSSHMPPRTSPYKGKRGGRVSVKNRHNVLGTSVDSQSEPTGGFVNKPMLVGDEPISPTNEDVNQTRVDANDDVDYQDGNRNINDTRTNSESLGEHIQILDLHGDNVIVSHKGQAYSCNWATALGTDLIFEHHLAATHSDTPSIRPLRSYSDFNLVAATSTRLVGKPIKLVPKETPSGNDVNETENQQNVKLKARQKQSEFLARFAALKAARGEKDKVPLQGKKNPGRRAPDRQMEGSANTEVTSEATDSGDAESSVDGSSVVDEGEISRPISGKTSGDRPVSRRRKGFAGRNLSPAAPGRESQKRRKPRASRNPEPSVPEEYRDTFAQSGELIPPHGQTSEQVDETVMDHTPDTWDGMG